MVVSQDKVYSQVNSVLLMLGEEYISKLPPEIMKLINSKKDSSYCPQYILSLNINEQDISDKALSMLTLFNLKYWCNDEEKEKILRKLDENEQKYQEKMQDVYSLKSLNQNNINNVIVKQDPINLIERKKGNIFIKIINKIKSMFMK